MTVTSLVFRTNSLSHFPLVDLAYKLLLLLLLLLLFLCDFVVNRR